MQNQIKKQKINFTQITNDLLNDTSITLSAKGIYCFMYSKPDGWNFTIKGLQAQLKEGYNAVSNALKELKDNGWIVYEKQKSGKSVYHLVWDKKPLNKPKSENPTMAQQSQNCKTRFRDLAFVEPKSLNPIMGFSNRISNTREKVILEEEEEKEKTAVDVPTWFPKKETILYIENVYGLTEQSFMSEVKNFKRYVITNDKKYPDLDSSFIIHVKNGIKNELIEIEG